MIMLMMSMNNIIPMIQTIPRTLTWIFTSYKEASEASELGGGVCGRFMESDFLSLSDCLPDIDESFGLG